MIRSTRKDPTAVPGAEPLPEATLRLLESGEVHRLSSEAELTIGRAGDNDVVLDREAVSRYQARIQFRSGEYTVEDLHSANGTFVDRDGELLRVTESAALRAGDILQVGPFRLLFQDGSAAQPDPAHGQPWGRSIHVPTVAAGFSHFFAGFLVWALPAVLAADIAADHGLSAVEAKILPATAIMLGAGARLFFGFMTDSRGPLRSGAWSLGLAVVALAVLGAFGNEQAVLWPAVALLGVGLASLPVALPLASQRTAPERRGLALGVVAAGSVGIAFAALIGPPLADALDWQSVFALAIVPTLAALGVFIYGARGVWSAPPRGAWRPMARGSGLRVVALIFGITFGSFAGLYTVLPAVLRAKDFELSVSEAVLVVALGALAGSVARVIGGTLADRVGSSRVLLWVMIATTALLIVAGNLPLALALVAFVATMAVFDAGTAAVLKMAAQQFGRTVGVGVGLVSAVGGLFGFAISILITSLFESTGSAALAFGVLAAAPAAGGAWLLIAAHRRPAGVRAPALPPGPQLQRLDPYGKPVEGVAIGRELSIGRAPGNCLLLSDDDYVSRMHAQLTVDEGQIRLRDLASTNGTMLWRNQRWQPIETEELRDGDIIVIGANVLRYAAGSMESET